MFPFRWAIRFSSSLCGSRCRNKAPPLSPYSAVGAGLPGMVSDLAERGEVKFQPRWVDQEKQARIEDACARLGLGKLTSLKDVLPPEITCEEIRPVIARLRRQQSNPQAGAAHT